jgi:hypothetical protein
LKKGEERNKRKEEIKKERRTEVRGKESGRSEFTWKMYELMHLIKQT